MKNLLRTTAIIATATTLSSCAYLERFNQKPSEITALERAPKIEVKAFFNGDIDAFAITQDNQGKIVGSYTAKMTGKWDDNKGVLQQNFTYNTGKKDSRTWLITVDSDGTFNAIGHDMTAPIKGRQLGNAMQMVYTLSLPLDGKKQDVNYEDNLYLVDDRSVIGISFIKKGGAVSGKSIISYKKIGKVDAGKTD